jgi:site-specific DNA-methyltransferase (adenine-specific)
VRHHAQSIIFGGNYFADLLPPSNCWIVWDKKGHHKFNNPFADAELAWTSFSRVVKKYTLVQQGFVTEAKEARFHPTQKPVELMRQIIRDFTKEGETILDPFMGSGSTGVAALLENRRFIGIEKDENYFNIAKARINEATQKEPLFV